MSNLVWEYLSALSVHECLKQLPRMGIMTGAQRIRSILSARLESSHSSEQMTPFMCTCSVWHPGRMLTSCCGLEDKLNDLHKVLMISSLKAEVAKKPSEEEACLILLWICSRGLSCHEKDPCSRLLVLDLLLVQGDRGVLCVSHEPVSPGPCIHASSDRQRCLIAELINFLLAVNVSTVNEIFLFWRQNTPKDTLAGLFVPGFDSDT